MKKLLSFAAILGLLSIILGAFGAHSLKEKLEPEALKSFETGVRYMMYHVLAILFIGSSPFLNEKSKVRVAVLFLIGILFFSGSIFAISTGLIAAKSIWFITPLGGVFFMLGWGILTWNFFQKKE